MKKFKKLILAGFLALSSFASFFGIKAASNNNVNAAEIPSGQKLDTTYDDLSISNLTIDGLTNQSMLVINKNQEVSYNKTDDENSLVFKFKYDVIDDTANDTVAMRVHFFYDSGTNADAKWNNENSLWIRGDGVHLNKWRSDSSSFSYSKKDALTKGLHTIEFGRIALLNESDDSETGDYYVYYKVDGVEINSCINPYDSSKFTQSTMFFNFSTANTSNKVYDANLTYEEPQIISVSDLNKNYSGDVLKPSKVYEYDMTNAPANKSVAFVANWVNKANDYPNFFIGGPGTFNNGTKDVEYNYYEGGSISPRQDKVYIYKTDANGYVSGNAKSVNYPTAMEIGEDKVYRVEYGRQAIMNGSTFTGRYHVYFKLDGQLIYAIDNVLLEGVAAGGYFRLGAFKNDLVDIYTKEDPKVISVGDLQFDGKSATDIITSYEAKEFTYDNTDHTDNYSLVFKFKYKVNDNKQNQIHMTNSANIWKKASSVILQNGGHMHLGKSTSTNNDVGWTDDKFELTVGQVYDVEFGRQALFLDGEFTGKYYVYLKIGDTIVKDESVGIPTDVLQGNTVFLTTDGHNDFCDVDYVAPTYETPDEISIRDLKYNGNKNQSITLDGHKVYSYTATAEHKSFVLKFTFNNTSALSIDTQIHLQNGWTGDNKGGAVLLWKDKCLMSRDSTANGKYTSVKVPYWDYAEGVNAAIEGKVNVEIGKLYVSSGSNAGKYYVYVKVNDQLINGYYASNLRAESNVFFTGSNGLVLNDINPETYEEADQITVDDLKLNGEFVGESFTADNKTYTYDATAAHKSVVFTFDMVRNGKSEGSQIHFNDDFLKTNGGIIWLRHDKNLIYGDGGDNASIVWASSAVNWVNGKNRVEVGKLYITSGPNEGKYYLYVKVNGKLDVSCVVTSMPDKANIFITKGTADTYYEINPTAYETADVVSIGDLKQNGAPYIDVITLDSHQTFTYDATATHKSVVYKFLYDVTGKGNIGIQFHFTNGWSDSLKGGMVWFSDKVRISKDSTQTWGQYVDATSPFTHNGIYEVELGKLYITGGKNTGKYYSYVKVDGELLAEYIEATMPDSNALFITGTNGDYMYDVDYMPVELNTGLYLYNWDVNNSGIQFAATLRKDFVAYDEISNVGFVIYPQSNPSAQIKVAGKLVASGDNYVVKAALLGFNANEFTSEYVAKLFYVVDGEERYSDVIATSFYDEVCKVSDAGAYQNAIDAVKAAVLNVTVDEDTMEVVGATKSGTDPIVLTGEKSQYAGFILNGKVVANGQTVKIGYTSYGVALAANTITLTKLDKDMVWGGSEHFVTLNSGHDTDMTVENLTPMTTELGLTSIRFDIYFGNLFTLTSNNQLKVNYDYAAKIQHVIDELKEDGGVNDFLAVLLTMLPYGYKTWNGSPWESATVPTDEANYLKWLQINGEAARITAELFPDIHNFETWNEPELGEVVVKVTAVDEETKVATTTTYSPTEKVKFLTDLMYYYNAGIKAANPDNVLTTSSLCCAQNTSDPRFEVTSYNFLKGMYEAINDDTPVPGYTEADKDANNYFQVINVHPYLILGVTTANWSEFVTSLNTLAAEYGDGGTEVWVTEFGFAQNRYSTAQADMLTVLGLAQNVDCLTKFYFYKVHDYTDKIDTDRWGLYNYDGSIKAIGTAVKAVTNPAV